jgi:TM2 domain-containing membrane protein YozV
MGIHKFYAGHIFSGIVFLALFFVGFLFTFIFGLGFLILTPLGVIAVIQGIIALCKTPGPDGKVEV